MSARVILHRGYIGKHPENSRPAFTAALSEQRWFETDIRVSRDGVCFMIHDAEVDRLLDGSGCVSALTAAALEQFRYRQDAGLRLVRLDSLCRLIAESERGSVVFLHIKRLEDLDPTLAVVREFPIRDRLRFFACDEITMAFLGRIRQNGAGYRVGLHVPDGSPHVSEPAFAKADFIWADETAQPNITAELVGLAHGLDKPVYAISPELIPESVFNKDVPGRWRELLALGVDGICTDRPGELDRVIGDGKFES